MRNCLLAILVLAGCSEPKKDTGLIGKPAPELVDGITWVNSRPVKLADLRGRVVLLNFMEYTCINSIRTQPYVEEWAKRYGGKGLTVIGVHTPQYDFSTDPQNVFAGLKRLGVKFPVVVDSHMTIAEAYDNRYWPRFFLIDHAGIVRFDHFGEGEYAKTELMIQQLLKEAGTIAKMPLPMDPVRETDRPGAKTIPVTPELYLGKLRGVLANSGTAVTNATMEYTLPEKLEEGQIYASGHWSEYDEYLRHARDTEEPSDFIVVPYTGADVNVVMRPESAFFLKVYVERDGRPIERDLAGSDISFDDQQRSFVKVDMPRVYNLIKTDKVGRHEIRLKVQGKGLAVYSVSFDTRPVPGS